MRRAFALLLALVIAASVGAFYAVRELGAPGDQVQFTETTLYGNISAAEGLQAIQKSQLSGSIVWDSRLDFFNAGFTTHTEYLYIRDAWNDPRYNDHWAGEFQGVFLYDDMNNSYETNGSDLSFVATDLTEFQQELIDRVPDGESGEMKIRLADGFDTYSIMANVDLPNIFYGYPEALTVDKNESPEIYAVQTIHEFFQIPVLPDQEYILGLEKAPDGTIIRSWGQCSEEGDAFAMVTQSVVAEDACYFWFSNRSNQGKLVDTSRIPGGYGIYILPYGYVDQDHYRIYDHYEGYDVFADKLRVFYPVDPQTEILGLTLSENQKTLLLYAVEEGERQVTVISTETGEALQKISLGRYEEDTFTEVIPTDNAVVIVIDHSISLLRPVSETEWELFFQTDPTPIECEESFSPLNTWYGRKMAFDGERLAIIGILNTENRWRSCGFSLAVYNADGLQYYGNYENSLDKANLPASEENRGSFEWISDLHEPNEVSWTA